MKVRVLLLVCSLIVALTVGTALAKEMAGKVTVLSGDELAKLVPASAVLDGQNAPVQKRNAVGAKMEDGKLLLVALVDTSGYSADYQQKYIGVFIAQGKLMFGGQAVAPGFYGLGHRKDSHAFVLYDMGGNQVAEAMAKSDEMLRPVTPIQLKAEATGAKLYLGSYFVGVSAH